MATRITDMQTSGSVASASPPDVDGQSDETHAGGFETAPPEATVRRLRAVEWLFAGSLVGATFLAYFPCWHGSWLWDDAIHLLANPVISPGGLAKVWIPGGYLNYWPLTYTVYWLEFHLWGLQPLGFHLVNIAFHALAALLVWRVLTRLNLPGALFAAAIFALHPVNVEAVAWVAQLKTVLSLVLALVSLLFYLGHEAKGGRWRYALAIGAFALSGLAKGEAVTLPIVLLAIAWWQRGRIGTRDILRVLPYFLIAAFMAGLEIWSEHLLDSGPARSDGILSRAAIAGCAVWFYLWKLIWPLNLNPMYPRWRIGEIGLVWYLPGTILLVALGAAWWRRRTWGRGVVMVIVGYVALLLPVLGFVNITYMLYSLVADHWQYVAMIVPCAATAAACAAIAGRHRRPRIARAGCLTVLFALAALTWRQSNLYSDPDLFYGWILALNPDSWVAENNWGTSLMDRGKLELSIPHYERSLQLNQGYSPTQSCLGTVLARLGRLGPAIEHLERALQLDPNDVRAHTNLGAALAKQGNLGPAVEHFQSALRLDPDSAEAHSDLGSALARQGKSEQGIGELQRALQLDPSMRRANFDMAMAFASQGDFDQAIAHFHKELEIDPHFELARQTLVSVVSDRNRLLDALNRTLEQLKRRPNDVALLHAAAWTLATNPNASIRDGGRAVTLAQRAWKLTGGDDPLALGTLAAAYAEAGRFNEAAAAAERGIQAARAAGNYNMASQIAICLAQFKSGKPFRELR